MALYTKESVDRVKEAVDMVALVGARTDLRRVGGRYTGLCPFHDERTPSFSVNAERALYHCFGCGASGDAIKFVEETEGLDFREAIELLAGRSGVELKLEQEDPRAEERRRRRERLLSVVERATAYYARYLWEAAEAGGARDYLAARGLREEVLREFRIGFAPTAFDRVVASARRDGFTVEELIAAGLGKPSRRGPLIDRFRGRIVFPLADPRGRVLGFGARALQPQQQPKYLNTAENEIYHKGRQLFGIDRARAPAAKAGRVVAVEGYTDVISLHQAGLRETVAIMGTALTADQLKELSRAAPTVYLALDADRSGQEAMLRAARDAAEREVELRVVALPDGADPAELVARSGAEAMEERLAQALSVPEFEVRRALAEADLTSPRGRDRAVAKVLPVIADLPRNSATWDHLVRYTADRANVPVEFLLGQLNTTVLRKQPLQPGSGRPPAASATTDSLDTTERTFLAMCIHEGRAARPYLERAGDEHFSSAVLQRARALLVDHLEEPLASLPEDDPELAAAIEQLAVLAAREPSSEAALRSGFLQLELLRLDRAVRRSTASEDFARQREALVAREAVRSQMAVAMGETA